MSFTFLAVTSIAIIAAIALWYTKKHLTTSSIKYKVISLAVSAGVAAAVIVAWLNLSTSSEALLHQQEQSLSAIRASRKTQIENYFNFINQQIFNFSQSRMISAATTNFTKAFNQINDELDNDTDLHSDIYNSLQRYYEGEYKPRLTEAGGHYQSTSNYIPEKRAARLLQWMYISANPNPVGEKSTLDRAQQDCLYNKVHAVYHTKIRDFLNSFGYYDIFLFDLQGNMVYSVFKETDFATNLMNGPYAQTNFGDVYRKTLAANDPNAIVIEDFKPYAPSYDAPASFIGSPIYHDGKKVGVAVFQMPVGEINTMMQQSEGMGDTGETYLVGSDKTMRSNSRFVEESTILIQPTDTPTVQAALNGESGVDTINDYRGVQVVSSYSPLNLNGLNWAIIAEMDLAEVMAPQAALKQKVVFIGLAVSLAVATYGFLFATKLVRPIAPIVTRAKQIAEGDLSGDPLIATTNDEMGQLTNAVNEMSLRLHTLVTEVLGTSHDVASAATEIASSSELMLSEMDLQTKEMDQAVLSMENMSTSMDNHQREVMQISAAIEQMSSSVTEVAGKSTEVADTASQAREIAERGGQVVSDTVNDIQQISEAVCHSATSVEELGKRSEKIGRIIEVINEIADQTNLLALNAAIEAARAGEHGRGFAVVADEVRKLADRTTKATDEIANSIGAIQTEMVGVVKQMDTGKTKVQTGVDRATEAGQSLKQIVNSAQNVARVIQSIAAAAEQQAATSEELSRAVSSIAEASTEQNNTGQEVRQVVSSALDVARRTVDAAKESTHAANQLSEKSESLLKLVERFKINQNNNAQQLLT